MNLFVKKIALYCLFLSFCSLYGQSATKEYEIIKYSADDNYLPQNSVKSIVKDKNGFIWLTTEKGLIRYDGSNFDVFDSENITGINSNRMSVFRGSAVQDSIYLQNDLSEYLLINNNKVTAINKKNIPTHFAIDNTIFSSKRLFVNKIHKTDNSYYSLENDLVAYYSSKNKLQWRINFVYDRNTIFYLFDNELYVIERNKILKLSKNKIVAVGKNNIYNKQSTILTNTLSQQTFIIKDSTISIVDQNERGFYLKTIFSNCDLSSSTISAAFYDIENERLYLGSPTFGLLVLKRKTFLTLSENTPNPVYYAQVPIGKNKFLSSSGQLFSTNSLQSTATEQLFDAKYSDMYILVLDKNENIWTKIDNKLYLFYKETKYQTFKEYTFKDRISIIYELKNGEIAIATAADNQIDGKLYISDFSNKKSDFVFSMGLKFIPTCLLEAENHILYAGSSTGLHQIDLAAKKYVTINTLSKCIVRNFFSCTSGKIWVTTYDKGFFLYDAITRVTTKFPLDKNKYLLSSHCIIEDNKGFFWISTNKGLFQVLKQNLIDYAAQKTKSVYYQCYDKSEGFATNEFNGGCQPAGLFLKNGFITFPSMNGIVMFDSNKVIPKTPTANIFFGAANADGKEIPIINNNITVEQGFEKLGIAIHSPYYGNADNLNIEVKLNGPITQKWQLVKNNYISFSALPPGTYFLTFRKLSGFNAHFQYKKLKIIIPKLFHQTFLFYIIILIVVLLLITLVIKLQVRNIKRKNNLLQSKIAEQTAQLNSTIKALKKTTNNLKFEIVSHKKLIAAITHDIKSPLRFLALTAQHLFDNKDNKYEAHEDIENVLLGSNQLYNYVDNLLEYSKASDHNTLSEPYSLFDLINEKIDFFKNIASSNKTTIFNSVNKNEILTVNKQLLSIILHNILDNAIKNTQSGKINFSATKDLDDFIVIIEDTGTGMHPDLVAFYNKRGFLEENEKKEIGLGIPMITELLDIIKGQIIIESNIGEGTKISILFKI